MGMAPVKVLRITTTVFLAKDGALALAEFRILRSDPMAGMIRRANPFGGEMEPPGADEGDEAKGKTTVYELAFASGDPSPRVRSFLRAAEAVLKQGK